MPFPPSVHALTRQSEIAQGGPRISRSRNARFTMPLGSLHCETMMA